MFAMHNDFRTEAAQRLAISGRACFKTAQTIANQIDARHTHRIFREAAGTVDFTLIKSVLQNPQGITLFTQDRCFGPYLPDDLILLAQ